MNLVELLFSEIEKQFPEAVEEELLNRGDILLHEGQVERYTYKIISGAVMVVYETSESAQIIRFGYKGSFLNSLPSFFDDSPSLFRITAIKRTRIIKFPKAALRNFLDSNESYRSTYNIILEGLVRQFVEREIDLLTSDPRERYQRVLKRSPEVFQEVPLKYIADYLRMAPETLSRLRNS